MNTFGYIVGRIWSGHTSLAKLYWGYGLFGALLWGILFRVITPGSPEAIAIVLGFLAFSVVVSVGLWRAAAKYQGWLVWAGFARVAAALGILQSLFLVLVLGVAAWESINPSAGKAQASQDVAPWESFTPNPPTTHTQLVTPPQKHTPTPAQQNSTAYADPLDREMALMDQMHPGWRHKVNSQEFKYWVSTLNPSMQVRLEEADTAAQLSGFITQFDIWLRARR